MASAQTIVEDCLGCCSETCPEDETLEGLASGIGNFPDCFEIPGDGYAHGTGHSFDGPFTVTVSGSSWTFTYDDGYSYTKHNLPDCSDEGDPRTEDLVVTVSCAVSDEGVRGITVVARPGGTVGAFFTLFEGGGDLDEPIANIQANGGTVTLTLP